MRIIIKIFILFCMIIASMGLGQSSNIKPLSLQLDKEDGVYSTGEKIILHVGADAASIPQDGCVIRLTMMKNGFYAKDLESRRITRDTPQIQYTIVAESSGWLLFAARQKDSKEKESRIGAIVNPLEIKPSMAPPDDFQIFWKNQVEQMRKERGAALLAGVESQSPSVAAFDLTIDMGKGNPPVSGYLAYPVSAKEKTLPAFLYVHGAGVRSSSLPASVQSALRGHLALDINAHGLPNGRPASFYDELGKGELKDYKYFGKEDRETWYFRKMFLRVQAALDYLASRPEWDGKNLMIYGSSQGGGQALAGAGLDPRVTAIALSVPALCDLTGCQMKRRAGWPQTVPIGEDYGCADEKIKQAARYFDGANFARFTNADAIFSVGFIDNTCPPTSVYSAYNQIKGEKKIIIKPQMGHEIPEDIHKELEKFLDGRIVKTAPVPL
ncbi:acetylxylan esterase [Candidatus Sumerlaeota bacterium]|nr:acetylxylan esterase [Candidatus Sumerlaeota bacterium]